MNKNDTYKAMNMKGYNISEKISAKWNMDFNLNTIIIGKIDAANIFINLRESVFIFATEYAPMAFSIPLIINEIDVAIAAPIMPKIGIK